MRDPDGDAQRKAEIEDSMLISAREELQAQGGVERWESDEFGVCQYPHGPWVRFEDYDAQTATLSDAIKSLAIWQERCARYEATLREIAQGVECFECGQQPLAEKAQRALEDNA